MEKEVERQLEAVDIDRVGAWEHPAPDPFIGVQTLPVAKSKHAKVRTIDLVRSRAFFPYPKMGKLADFNPNFSIRKSMFKKFLKL